MELSSTITSGVTSIDLCFVIDGTTTMAPFMKKVRSDIDTIVRDVKAKRRTDTKLALACVVYRDFGDFETIGSSGRKNSRLSMIDFTSDLLRFHAFLDSEKANGGGGDRCEDVLGGLDLALKLTWTANCRLIYHICDDPPHGLNYHQFFDKIQEDEMKLHNILERKVKDPDDIIHLFGQQFFDEYGYIFFDERIVKGFWVKNPGLKVIPRKPHEQAILLRDSIDGAQRDHDRFATGYPCTDSKWKSEHLVSIGLSSSDSMILRKCLCTIITDHTSLLRKMKEMKIIYHMAKKRDTVDRFAQLMKLDGRALGLEVSTEDVARVSELLASVKKAVSTAVMLSRHRSKDSGDDDGLSRFRPVELLKTKPFKAVVAIDFGTHGTSFSYTPDRANGLFVQPSLADDDEKKDDGFKKKSSSVLSSVSPAVDTSIDISIYDGWSKDSTKKTRTSILLGGPDLEDEVLDFGEEAHVRATMTDGIYDNDDDEDEEESEEEELDSSDSDNDDGSDKSRSDDPLKSALYFDMFKMALYDTGDELDGSTMTTTTTMSVGGVRKFLYASNRPSQKVSTSVVISKALEFVGKKVIEELTRQYGTSFTNRDIRWVLTVPAIWSEKSKGIMWNCAVKVGLVDPSIRKHMTIQYEPECVTFAVQYFMAKREREKVKNALKKQDTSDSSSSASSSSETSSKKKKAVPDDLMGLVNMDRPKKKGKKRRSSVPMLGKKMIGFGSMQHGDRCIVADLGGGTADIACHEILSSFRVRSIRAPEGGRWGSMYVDKAFEELLIRLFTKSVISSFQTMEPKQWQILRQSFVDSKQCIFSKKGCFRDYDLNKIGSERQYYNVELPTEFISHLKVEWSGFGLDCPDETLADKIAELVYSEEYGKGLIKLSEIRLLGLDLVVWRDLFETCVQPTIDLIARILDEENSGHGSESKRMKKADELSSSSKKKKSSSEVLKRMSDEEIMVHAESDGSGGGSPSSSEDEEKTVPTAGEMIEHPLSEMSTSMDGIREEKKEEEDLDKNDDDEPEHNFKYLIAVGGFSESNYVIRRLDECFGLSSEYGLQIVPVKDKMLTVVRGACLMGLHSEFVCERIVPYTYGIIVSEQLKHFHERIKRLIRSKLIRQDYLECNQALIKSQTQERMIDGCMVPVIMDVFIPCVVKGESLNIDEKLPVKTLRPVDDSATTVDIRIYRSSEVCPIFKRDAQILIENRVHLPEEYVERCKQESSSEFPTIPVAFLFGETQIQVHIDVPSQNGDPSIQLALDYDQDDRVS